MAKLFFVLRIPPNKPFVTKEGEKLLIFAVEAEEGINVGWLKLLIYVAIRESLNREVSQHDMINKITTPNSIKIAKKQNQDRPFENDEIVDADFVEACWRGDMLIDSRRSWLCERVKPNQRPTIIAPLPPGTTSDPDFGLTIPRFVGTKR